MNTLKPPKRRPHYPSLFIDENGDKYYKRTRTYKDYEVIMKESIKNCIDWLQNNVIAYGRGNNLRDRLSIKNEESTDFHNFLLSSVRKWKKSLDDDEESPTPSEYSPIHTSSSFSDLGDIPVVNIKVSPRIKTYCHYDPLDAIKIGVFTSTDHPATPVPVYRVNDKIFIKVKHLNHYDMKPIEMY